MSGLSELEGGFDLGLTPDIYSQMGAKYDLDPLLLKAWARTESSENDQAMAKSKYGVARGRMQMLPIFAKAWGVKDPTKPEQAVEGAARFLRDRLDKGISQEDAFKEYHGGPDTKLWGPKTTAYPLDIRSAFQELGGVGSAQAATPPPKQVKDPLTE